MRWLVRFLPTETPKETLLGSMRALARSVGVEARNPKWTSHGALELDVFSPTAADFEIFIAAAMPIAETEYVTDLNRAPEHLTDQEALSKAKRLFNAERYWEAHEVLEGLWRQKRGDEKRLLQGIILVCAAFVHHQKGEEGVAVGVLRRATGLLDSPSLKYGVIDLSSLRNEALRMLKARELSGFSI